MISVQNRLLPLNGNNFRSSGIIFLFFALVVASCTPRARVLDPKAEAGSPEVEEKIKEEVAEVHEKVFVPQIAMLLPFELNRSTSVQPSQADVERAALALDFYQGFQLGLAVHADAGSHFKLTVLDSRDNENEVALLAQSEAVQDAALVVGPIYPKEITAFGKSAGLSKKDVLQISPLAASMPTEFNLSNLVSITSPIITHVEALAKQILEGYRSGDVVILYNTEENSSQQFLPALRVELQKLSRNITIHEVAEQETLLERLRHSGNNLIVCGSTNRFRLTGILNELKTAQDEHGFRIKLYGHPNWARMIFGDDSNLENFQPIITSSYYIDQGSRAVRDFEERYRDEFHVAATEFAYKGYDAGYYFGGLLSKYGADYKKYLTETSYDGLHNSFGFEYNPTWGYVNTAILFLTYRDGRFVRLN